MPAANYQVEKFMLLSLHITKPSEHLELSTISTVQ